MKLTLPKGFRAEHYPNPLPDLYVGDPISIALRGKKSTGLAMLEGKIGNQNWLVKIPLDQAAYHTGIAKVWAREKIANLEHQEVRPQRCMRRMSSRCVIRNFGIR